MRQIQWNNLRLYQREVSRCFDQWKTQWNKCVECQEDYYEEMEIFNFRNKKKFHQAWSGEYRGCCPCTILFCQKHLIQKVSTMVS